MINKINIFKLLVISGALTASILISIMLKFYFFQFYQVTGNSMNPILNPGDQVLVEKISPHYRFLEKRFPTLTHFFLRPLKISDMIIFYDDKKEILIKKISRVQNHEYYVLGENKNNSIDSRQFGTIPDSKVIGRVIKVFKRNSDV